MDSGATDHEVLEKKLEKKLEDPTAEPMSLPLEFLKVITCDFCTERELGRGAYGVVYKGVLQSGKVIAVKKIFDAHLLDSDNNNNNKQFENEITCLMGIRHQNVIQLVGYCVQTRSEVMKLPSGEHVLAQTPACLLCFEFQCKGSLDKHVSDDFSALDWYMRYEIIRGVCRGLHYLHHECHIVHLDLKPQNILMDAMMMPKITDFGLSRLLGEQKSKTVTKKLAGTFGYMAKEYIDKGIISPKADIFSLGVIIIEIITGRRDYPNISERTGTSNNISERTETSLKHFTEEVVGCWRKKLEITPMHMSLEMHIQQVEQCISIALKCLAPDSNKRPTSLDIVQSLNAEEPKCSSLGKPPIVAQKDRRQNKNLQSRVNMNIINIWNTIGVIIGVNECANLFQWVTSAISSLKSQSSERQKERLQGDVHQLQSDLQCLSDTLPAMYNLINRDEWRIHDYYVAELLSRLKDTIYDAEDLLDEFRSYETKVSVDGNAMLVEPEDIEDEFRWNETKVSVDGNAMSVEPEDLIDEFRWYKTKVSVDGNALSVEPEDLLDEFRWYETKVSINGNAMSVEPVIDFHQSISFNNVTDIQKRLNHLSKQLEKMGLLLNHLSKQLEKMGLLQAVPWFEKSFRSETTSLPTEAKIFGRDEEKNKLMRLIGVPTNNCPGPSRHKRQRSGVIASASNQISATIDSNEPTVTSVLVSPIVGIGDVGKTTLAQDISQCQKIKSRL